MALKALNSVGGFSVGETPANVIYPNSYFTGNGALFSGNVAISNANANWGILTDNIYYSNGAPWDLQQAAGSNTQIQFNNNNDFGASANLTFDSATNLLTVAGNIQTNNANLGNLITANFANITSNIVANNITVNADLSANTANLSGNLIGTNANFSGNVYANYFVGNVAANITITAGNTEVLFSNAGLVQGSNAFTFNFASNILTVNGTANVTGNIEVDGILTDNYYYANGSPVDFQQAAGSNTQIQFNNNNDFGASANLTFNSATDTLGITGLLDVTGNVDVSQAVNGNIANFSGNLSAANANLGNLATANYVNVANDLTGNIANFSGNLTAANANLGNLATANYVNVANDLTGNIANFSGNLTAANANLGNLAIANYINVANDLNVIGNVNAGNLVGTLANGTSNVRIFQDANIEISAAGNANVVTVTGTGLIVTGNIQSTTGNILANGNVTANGFLVGANASVTSEANVGSLKTANINATTGNITISAAGSNENIILAPTGTGAVSISGKKIINLADPVNATDAATKEYVDAIAGEGLDIHAPVRVESPTALNATYAQGGTTPTVDSISGNKTIDFGSAHGLSVNDGIVFTNSFNGLVGGEAYWVYSVPSSTSITVKDGYYGPEVTTLTNGTSLAQPSRANPGVGATLTNAGANAALQIDGISLSVTNRVLIYTQTNAYENGVYTVTTVGDGSTAWVLTRATDFDKYLPDSPLGLSKGSYVFVEQGLTGAGESYVMTLPIGEVIIGTDNLTFTQFSAAGSYTAGNGINITGSIISANVDGVTTDIVSGNIVVKSSANLTTPNIGDATFSSLSWNTLSNGNVTANNLSIGNIANITLDLTVGGNIQANGTISANANVSGLNITTSGNVQATGNVLANNVAANTLLTVPIANVSNIVNAGNVSITNALLGNTANFSGNVILPNLTVNLEIAGNTANFSGVTVSNNIAGNTANFTGNISAANANLGNLVTANFFTGTLINGTSNVAIPTTNGNINLTANGNSTLIVTDTGANVTGYLDVTGNISAGNISVNNVSANTLSANLSVGIGNTEIGWGTVTTSTIGANQTIAQFAVAGVTGVEFLVKGIDSTGGKYSVATVTAVTDGATNTDYAVYATAIIGGATGTLVVNKTGSNLALQVTPTSSNSTVWTAQYRTI